MAARAKKLVLAVVLLLMQTVAGHMEMSSPYPINSQLNPAVPSNLKDYSYTSPLDSSGANFPCKGYQNDRPALVTATYTAGQSYKMTFAGSATHGGGSCQISLSYDNGKTFRVIKSMIGGCPLPKQYDFTIPSYAPGGTALLSWSWYNLVGNREIYNDCAWISITNSSSTSRRRHVKERRASQEFTSFEQLPYMWKANLPDNNDCKTVEGQNPVFPNPGPDVVYGDGESASSPPTAGSCESPNPPGAAYKEMAVPGGSGPPESGPSGSGSSSSSSTVGQSTPIATPSYSTPSYSQVSPVYGGGGGSSSSSILSVASSSSLVKAIPQTPTTTVYIPNPTGTSSSGAGSSSSGSSSSGSSTGGSLGFASNPPDKSFYPCTPGTFLCTSSTTFLQCASSDWWVDMGSVAAGTQCQPQSGSGGARKDQIVAG